MNSGDWYLCMFWGAMVVILMTCFFFICLYAASSLDDMKKALEVLKHD